MVEQHWKFKSKFKYTATDTQQQNSYAEMGFTALVGMVRSMLNQVNISRAIRYKLCGKVSKTATKLDQRVVIEIDGIKVKKTRVKYYAGMLPLWEKYTRTFGKTGTVRTGKDGKVGDRGVTMMFLGYTEKHEGNSYIMFKPSTGSVLRSHVM